jgi:hypothetical protein
VTTFICYTPLHILIVQKIITKERINKFCLIYISENRSKKNLHYYSFLRGYSRKSIFFVRKGSWFDFIRILIPVANLLFQGARRGIVYTGNIKTMYSRFLIWLLRPTVINTFDDGVANIFVEGANLPKGYLEDTTELQLSAAFFSIVNKSMLYKNVINRIAKHFSIYQYPNVFKNTVYVPLFEKKYTAVGFGTRINLLLTSALALEYYMSPEQEQDFYDRIIKKYDINLLIKHPRNERYHPSIPCKVSDSLLIAEDQILELMKENEVMVYATYYSTVLVNIPPSVAKFNLILSNPPKDNPELKAFFDTIQINTIRI